MLKVPEGGAEKAGPKRLEGRAEKLAEKLAEKAGRQGRKGWKAKMVKR